MAKRTVLAKSGIVGLDFNYFSSFNAIATPEIYLAASVLSTIQSRPQDPPHLTASSFSLLHYLLGRVN